MLSIRLMPVGKKHQRSFRLVVDTKRHKLRGKNVEDLGWYNPHTNTFDLKNERVQHWLENGAQPTDTVHNLLVRGGVIKGKKIAVHSKAKKKEEAQAEEKPAEEVKEEAPAPEAKEEASVEAETEQVPEASAEPEAPAKAEADPKPKEETDQPVEKPAE